MLVLAKTSMCALLCNPAPPCKPQPCSMGTLVGLFSCHERACAACLFLHLKPMSHLVFASPCTVQAHAGAVPAYLVLRTAVAFCRRAAVWSPDIACACPNGAASPNASRARASRWPQAKLLALLVADPLTCPGHLCLAAAPPSSCRRSLALLVLQLVHRTPSG